MKVIRNYIPGFKDCYIISNTGKVKRVKYKFKIVDLDIKTYRTYRGYEQVHLFLDGIQKNMLVHRCVAITFLSIPEGKYFVNHKDGNKLNNNVENLERCTCSENIKHAKNILGKHIGYNTIKIKGTNAITGNEIFFNSLSDAKNLGFRTPLLSQCINGKRKSYKGYIRTKI